jgi:hypothetical protein
MYNLNYTPTNKGYKLEVKLYLGVHEQKRLNTTGLENLGAPMSHNPMGLHGLLQGQIYVVVNTRIYCSKRISYIMARSPSVYVIFKTMLGPNKCIGRENKFKKLATRTFYELFHTRMCSKVNKVQRV